MLSSLAEKPSLVSQKTFGFARDWEGVTVEGIMNLLRIETCIDLIFLDFDFIFLEKGVARCFRRLTLTETGKTIIENHDRVKDFSVPDPFHPGRRIDSSEKKVRKKSGSSHFGWPQMKEHGEPTHSTSTIYRNIILSYTLCNSTVWIKS